MVRSRPTASRRWLVGAIAASVLVGAGCGGENAFRTLAVGDDRQAPVAEILAPASDEHVAVGDSILVRVRLRDDVMLATLELRGVSRRGSVELGTQVDVPRFETRTVSLENVRPPVRDTVIARFLHATADTVAGETAFLIALVTDAAGNEAADTVRVVVGGALAPDLRPPLVRFSVNPPARVERGDSIAVTVVAEDDRQLDRLGVTIRSLAPGGVEPIVLSRSTPAVSGETASLRFSLGDLVGPASPDTATVRLEVTAHAVDAAGNCAAAARPDEWLSERCIANAHVVAPRPGAAFSLLLMRGSTALLPRQGDRLIDIASDGQHVFASNITRGRIEVLPVGGSAFSGSIQVGSRPWGIAFNRERTRLYVANSGGTNISVVSPTAMVEESRIPLPNVKLFDVALSEDEDGQILAGEVTTYDYSDRPQFIGVTRAENLIFSTLPTAAAPDGTVRYYRRASGRHELFTGYVGHTTDARVTIAEAASVTPVGIGRLQVCPGDGGACVTGSIDEVEEALAGTSTRFLYGLDVEQVGLSDTTFVAVSGDHGTIALGEGVEAFGRIMLFSGAAGDVNQPLLRFGDTADLVGNTAERVVGLALNVNGNLGLARGNDSYVFSRDLRLQGFVDTDPAQGGVALHPERPTHAGDPQGRAFVSGIDPHGLAYIDVIDTFHFHPVNRIFVRDPVTGPIHAIGSSDGGLILFAITARGVVRVELGFDEL